MLLLLLSLQITLLFLANLYSNLDRKQFALFLMIGLHIPAYLN